jgi:hypothetical protein
MSDRTATEDDVRAEHLAEVHVAAHWAYIVGVVAGGFVLMVALMALLGG